ncbi:MAG TPA: hypothetical protein PK075_10620, partial [Chitinophagales bacterium]|nr:hypothetical protein [Chitinophagales bacterium]
MKLKSEIQIQSFDELADRIEIASGVTEIKSINFVLAKPQTFVPINNWRKLDKEELKSVTSSIIKYTDVSIVKMPTSIINIFKKLKISDSLNIEDINFIQKTKEYQNALDKLLLYLEEKFMFKNNYEVHNLFFGKPNLSNNTFNTKENVYIGLHLDSWEKQSFDERPNARNRICINLGKEPR